MGILAACGALTRKEEVDYLLVGEPPLDGGGARHQRRAAHRSGGARGRSATLSCSKSTRGDELPEFPRNVLESCGTLENGTVSIASAAMSLTFPARFMLAAAMNPCPCGYPSRDCHLTQPMIQARCRRSPGRYSIASKSTSTFRRCDTRNCGPALPPRALAIFANV